MYISQELKKKISIKVPLLLSILPVTVVGKLYIYLIFRHTRAFPTSQVQYEGRISNSLYFTNFTMIK